MADTRAEACRVTRCNEGVALHRQRAICIAVENESFARESLQRQRAAAIIQGEPVPAGQRHDHRLFRQQADVDSFRLGFEPADEDDIDFVASHAFSQIGGVALDQ